MDSYVSDGMRTRKGRHKNPATLKYEQAYLKPLRMNFGGKQAAAVSLADCDGYRDWRISGGRLAGVRDNHEGNRITGIIINRESRSRCAFRTFSKSGHRSAMTPSKPCFR
jgi:hypothetical protein